MATAARREQQCGIRLLEEVAVAAQLLLLLLGHAGGLRRVGPGAMQREVIALQLASKAHEALHDDALNVAPLLEPARWRQLEAAHTAPGAAARRQDVVARGVDGSLAQVVRAPYEKRDR
eukprot:gene125-biopygen135